MAQRTYTDTASSALSYTVTFYEGSSDREAHTPDHATHAKVGVCGEGLGDFGVELGTALKRSNGLWSYDGAARGWATAKAAARNLWRSRPAVEWAVEYKQRRRQGALRSACILLTKATQRLHQHEPEMAEELRAMRARLRELRT